MQKQPSFRQRSLKQSWKSLVACDQINDNTISQSDNSQQFCVDEYLKSIDRRYRRLHQSECKDKRGERGVTNAWTWLTAYNYFLEKEKGEEDALYVLGLAKLASENLLQKHHSPIMHLYELSHRATDFIAIDVNREKVTMEKISTQVALVVNLFVELCLNIRTANSYRYTIASLQLRAWFYDMLRCTGSTLANFLASLNLRFQTTKGGKITGKIAALLLATILPCTFVVTKSFND